MWQIFILFSLLACNTNVILSFKGRLYGIDKSSSTAVLVQIINNSTDYDRILNLGRASFFGGANAMKSIDNQNYIATYYISDSLGVPHYYILTIDIQTGIKIKSNLTINGRGIGSFCQIADDEKYIVGIRESMQSGASLELATIDQGNGQVQTGGLYPYGTYGLIMTFARERRLYYNVMYNMRNIQMFYGINIDTGSLDINIVVSNNYLIYAIFYDSFTDRLISLVYSSTIVNNAWFLAKIDIDKQSSTMKFERIGTSSIPMGDKYLWSTTYTLALKERQWLTLWNTKNNDNSNTLITFNIDTGEIIEKQLIKNSNYLNNIVYFD